MRLLLDTHTLVWSLSTPTLLSSRAAALLRERSNTLCVSAASAWEIAAKHRLGKLRGIEPLVANYADHLAMLGALELAIESRHALLAGSFATPHRDPFDRMLAAQAILERLPLITADTQFQNFPELQTIW